MIAAAHPDEGVGRLPAVETGEVGADRLPRGGDRLLRHGAVEPESLGEARSADVDAELLLDPAGRAERELRAPAAGVEDDERPAGDAEARGRGDVGEPGLLLAGDHLDLDAAPLADGVHELGRVRRDSHSGRADGGDLLDTVLLGLGRHARDRLGRARDRLLAEAAGVVEALAEPRDLGAVGDGPPGAVRLELADVELHRVGPDVDHGETAHSRPTRALRPWAMQVFGRPARPSSPHGRDHGCRVLELDRDRARGPAVGGDLREL